jgi:hypothetical protein
LASRDERPYNDYGKHPLGEARTEGGMVVKGENVGGNLVRRADCVFDFCKKNAPKRALL